MRSHLFQEALLILYHLPPYLDGSDVATGHLSHHITGTSSLKSLTPSDLTLDQLIWPVFSVL